MPVRVSGQKVREKMMSLNITTADLIKKTGLSVSTIDRITNDRATSYSAYTIKKLADALHCEPFEIFTEEAVKAAINEALSQAVENVVAEAVVEAVTVVTDEVAPEAPAETVAEAVPPISVTVPPALDIPAYIDHIIAEHKQEIENITKSHDNHIADLRREKHAWQGIAGVLAAAVVVCALLLMR